MSFLVADSPPALRQDDEFTRADLRTVSRNGFGVGRFDVFQRAIDHIDLGETRYPLKTSLRGQFMPELSGGEGTFRVAGFPAVAGRGRNVTEAIRDWKEQFHVTFQELIAKRPFEMDRAEFTRWRDILQYVDLAKYRNANPVKARRFGRVVDARPGHYRVEWDSGDSQSVSLDRMPAGFATYRPGQPFEAIVVYDSASMQFRRVEFIARAPVSRLAPDERQRLWESMKTTHDLPDASWT